ncbi:MULTISPECIES: maleylpyruvate isomerase family mycothiol-dependent enzyme [Streptomyces]|uniref:maleylpyruvate isomerase family mycothiol-dependent enzyme n=1 Tax=Streptomyces TaxID=1883 RepID=UPI00163BADF4|nr:MULTISPECIES: maleylpyruvate isomerase family mycothiol-dependent enzyme [Streptomyces]MBC2878542.1 maleylpyruvate isomerase family mycothiol-dependent enzyme [Streptomyces sp. TYQ1024]UBI35202.1 maleylpyruvate isomerase family mycothiol-dependent enzyme [Streptomyces mobaraensis]UKW27794.1 maleylpyruvate isomerase family mycothiol-dependent enzyme [Streptomyces sp. TYQ1024]
MSVLTFDRHRAEITGQAGRLLSHVDGVPLTAPVASCPGWTVAHLLRHVTGALTWAGTIVASRATEPVPHDIVDDVEPRPGDDPVTLAAELARAAERLAEALGEAGPDTAVWSPGPVVTTGFWARRMAHETAVHRADAALAAGVRYTLDDAVALDALDEWTAFAALPEAYGPRPGAPDLLGPARTLRFEATGTAADPLGEWLIDLTGDAPVRRRAAEPAAVTVRGTPGDLLLAVYRRPVPEGTVEVLGDAALFDLWRTRAGFWLEE